MLEVAQHAKHFGVPLTVITMIAHLYSGPRRIRVGRAVSKALYPRRSVLAGCTWAMLAIRIIVAVPLDKFISDVTKQFRDWGARLTMNMYVDDAVVITTGRLEAVAFLHKWISRLVLQWIAHVLRKEVALSNMFCVVSNKK